MENESDLVLVKYPVDDKLVNEAVIKIKEIYFKHATAYYFEIAEYLFETFFNSDIELLRKKTPALEKKESFYTVFQRLKDEDPRLPGKSWSYNLLRLKVQEHDYQDDKELFQTYGKLSLSHKTELLKVSNPDEKKKLINDTHENEYSVRDLKKKISEMRPQKARKINPIPFPKCIENIKSNIKEWKMLFDQYSDMGSIQDDVDKVNYKIRELETVINNIKI